MTAISSIDRNSTEARRDTVDFQVAQAPELISAISQENFFAVLAGCLRRLYPYECLIIFLYRRGAAPILLHDTSPPEDSRQGISNYLRNTYVLSPFYRAFLSGIEPGLYFMRDLVPREPFEQVETGDFDVHIDHMEEIGFLTHGWPRGMEELLLAFPLPDGALIEVSLSISSARGGVAGVSRAPLETMFPLLLSCIRKHWEIASVEFAPAPEEPRLEKQFQSFGSAVLTQREQEIVRMILLGHSSASIAMELDIALPTVKTHRRNAYEKLGISSLAGLLAIFLRSVQEWN